MIAKDSVLLAQRLIQFPSVTPVDAGIIDFIISILEPHGFTCHKIISKDVTNLYARYGYEDKNFCFAGHTDVVPPGENWKFDPFAGIIDSNNLYGRGASDMKAAIAAFILASIDFIKNNKFNGSISFMISGNEEGIPDNGTPKIIEYLAKSKEKIDACIVGEPTCSDILGDIIKYGRRGSITFELEVIGIQGHVAYPHLARNPINILLNILNELKQVQLDEGNENFDPSNLEITNINVGNEASNVIPSKAQAVINIRFNDFHTDNSLTQLVNDICQKYTQNYKLNFECSAIAFKNSKDSDLIKILSNSIKSVTNINPVLSTTGGTSDARFITNICPVIEFGLINKTAHHVDEYVSIKDIENLKLVYQNFLELYFR